MRPGDAAPPDAPVALRAARPGDAGAIAALLIDSRRAHLPYAPIAHPDDDVRRWVREELLVAADVRVACRGDRLDGVLAMAVRDGVGWVDQLYLRPGTTGAGLGARLLAVALASLPRPVRLWTFQANGGARRFYARHGFVAVACGDGSGNEEGVPDVCYERTDPGGG